jgi:hypothetical protein
MRLRKTFSSCIALGLLMAPLAAARAELAVTSSAETGGPTPQQLVEEILNEASGITLVAGTVTTTIDAPATDPPTPDPESSPRAMLPPENQNASGNAAYSGGLGIASGVCLCTGIATDDDPQINPQHVIPGLDMGVEGPNNGRPLEQGN